MKNNFNEMSNAELKLCIEGLENKFNSLKTKLISIGEEMGTIEKEYLKAKQELEIRKNLFI